MIRILKSCFFSALVFFTIVHTIWAQSSDWTMVHLDKPYYVVGEVVNYQIYLPTIFQRVDPIFEVLIYSAQGTVIHRSYLEKVTANTLSGAFKIPYETTPGIQQLMVKVVDEKNYRKLLIARASLPIYGTSPPVTTFSEPSLMPGAMGNQYIHDSKLKVDIQLQPEVINTREQVKLRLKVTDENGLPVKTSISVSVTDIGIIGGQRAHPFSTLQRTTVSIDSVTDFSKDIPVTGQLENREKGVLLTFHIPSTDKMYYAATQDHGVFQLFVPPFYGDRNLNYVGQFSSGKIELSEIETIDVSHSLPYPRCVIAYIDESRKRRNIYQIYNKTELIHQNIKPEEEVAPKPDKEYITGNFPFPDLPSFCRGVSSQLKYIKDKEQGYLFKMFDPESRDFLIGSPLFIVDGQITKNTEFLAALDFQAFERIMLFYDRQRLSDYFGFAGFNGVVKIISREGNLKVPESASIQQFQIQGLQPVLREIAPSVSDNNEPIFRPQLFWTAAQETDSQGIMDITYQQSDDYSVFQIEVAAMTEDGRFGYGKLEYQVYTGLSNSSK